MADGVLGIEGTRTVQADPRGAVAAARGGDVDADLRRVEQPPVRGRTAMAEDGTGRAREDRGQPVPLDPQRAMSDAVDAAIEQLQPPQRQPLLHRTARHPQRPQLRTRHHPPLRRRQPRDRRERGWARQTRTIRFKRAHPLSMALSELQRTPRTRQISATAQPSVPWPRSTGGAERTRRARQSVSAAKSPAPQSSCAPAHTADPRRR
jgi:hypothetical protein